MTTVLRRPIIPSLLYEGGRDENQSRYQSRKYVILPVFIESINALSIDVGYCQYYGRNQYYETDLNDGYQYKCNDKLMT